jgi:hypothetical protein
MRKVPKDLTVLVQNLRLQSVIGCNIAEGWLIGWGVQGFTSNV